MQNIILPISVSEDLDYFKEPFSWWQAWFDLVLLAASSTEEKDCIFMSERELSERWKWKRWRVREFLEHEAMSGKIEITKQKNGNVLKIPKLGRYVKKKRISELPKAISLPAVARELFERFYEQLFDGEAYYWSAKDSSAMDKLMNKIKHSRTIKKMSVAPNDLIHALQLFLESITDDWILRNFSVPVINSKYNEIVLQAKTKLKNGIQKTDKRRGTEVSASSEKDYEGEF